MDLQKLFGVARPIIGMLHLPPLPGSPQNTLGLDAIVAWTLQDAEALASGGVHGLLLENFGDAPFFPGRTPPQTAAFMTRLACEVKRRFSLPLGINVLRNDSMTALAVAAAAGAQFIRVNVHTGARLTDQGLIQGAAHRTLRHRRLLGCDVKIFADVDVKHSAPLAYRELRVEVEELVSRGGADAVIVSGAATGKTTAIEDLQIAKNAAGAAPVFAGSGVDMHNAGAVLSVADGAIVGTSFKENGVTTYRVDVARVRDLVRSVRDA